MGTLPGGTIFRNVGGAGTLGNDRLTGELSQVLRIVMFEDELPPANMANPPVEENAMVLAGALKGWV